MKKLLSNAFSGVSSVMFDNSDGAARLRRNQLMYNWLEAIITTITTGTYFTGLMLYFDADEQYISIITSLISLCGIAQLLSPMLLEKFEKRKTLLISLKSIYFVLNVAIIMLIPIMPISRGGILTAFFITTMEAYFSVNIAA